MKWLRWLIGRERQPAPEAVVARELSESISRSADEIKAHFEKYQRSRDPFAAMMADMYNRDQLTRVHRGMQQ